MARGGRSGSIGRSLQQAQRHRDRQAVEDATQYRRTIIHTGPPGEVKTQRYLYGKNGQPGRWINVRHKTWVVLDCGHGKIGPQDELLKAGLHHDTGVVWLGTKDVHPTVDMSKEEKEALLAAGKKPPRPLRSVECDTCLSVRAEEHRIAEKARKEAELAEYVASGKKAEDDARYEELQAQATHWEDLDMALFDKAEECLGTLVDRILGKLGIESGFSIDVDQDGGLQGASEYESLGADSPYTHRPSVQVYTDEDLDGLARTARLKEIRITMTGEQFLKVAVAVGEKLRASDLEVSWTREQAIEEGEKLLKGNRNK